MAIRGGPVRPVETMFGPRTRVMLKQRQRANFQHLHVGIALHCSDAALDSQQVHKHTQYVVCAHVPVCSKFGGGDQMRTMMFPCGDGPRYRGPGRACVCVCRRARLLHSLSGAPCLRVKAAYRESM